VAKKWEIVDKPDDFDNARFLVGLITGGLAETLYRDTYQVKNLETGEYRRVAASTEEELGQKIERGEFVKEDD
jgi:hypothetical protein